MKKKISILFAVTAIIAVMTINFKSNGNNNYLSDINLKVLSEKALADDPEQDWGDVACSYSSQGCLLCDGSFWPGHRGLGAYC